MNEMILNRGCRRRLNSMLAIVANDGKFLTKRSALALGI